MRTWLGFVRRLRSRREIRRHDYVLTPGRYVGAESVLRDEEPFDEKMQRLTGALRAQQEEAAELELNTPHLTSDFGSLGRLLETGSFAANARGYRELLAWARQRGSVGGAGVKAPVASVPA